jgi:hypothetical protein
LSYARLDTDFGTDNFAGNDDFEAAVFLAAAAVLSSAKGCPIPQQVVVMEGRDPERSDRRGHFPARLRIVFVHGKQSFNRAKLKEKWGKLTDDDLALKALDAAADRQIKSGEAETNKTDTIPT